MDPRARRALTRLERLALAVLALGSLLAWGHYRVLPTYDSLSSLVWGRDIAAGRLPDFAWDGAPTEHPLWVAASALLAPLGPVGARGMTLVTVACLVALLAGTYRLGRATFGVAAGALGATILLTRLDFGFYAAFAFVDVPFAAAIIWAAVLEAEGGPRRGGPVWLLLIVAGLLRPEAWAYAFAYGVWTAWRATARQRLRIALAIVIAPAGWTMTDLLVTGHPLFSFTYTTSAAASLGRQRGVFDLPRTGLGALEELLKAPVLVVALAGVALAAADRLLRRPDHAGIPAALLAAGVATFCADVLGGFSGQVPRYAIVASIALALFAGNALTRLAHGLRSARRPAIHATALALLLAGTAWSATHLHPRHATSILAFRARVEGDLRIALRSPWVRDGRRCGPLAVPNHKLLPIARWLLGGRQEAVVSRTDPRPDRNGRPGVTLLELGPRLLSDAAYGDFGRYATEPTIRIAVPPAGFVRRGRTEFFAIYARC